MNVPGNPLFIFLNDQQQLGVGLKIAHAVNNKTTCLLELFRLAHVILFIKSGFYFKEDGDVLPVFGCPQQRLGDPRLLGQSVNGHFDGHDIRVVRRLFYQFQYWINVVIRMVKQYILMLKDLKDVFSGCVGIGQGRHRVGWMRDFVLKPPVADYLPKTRKVQHAGPADLEDAVITDHPPFLQKVDHPFAVSFFNFYTHNPPRLPFIEFSFYLLQKVGIHIVTFLQSKVAVPGNPEKVDGFNVYISEQRDDVLTNNFLDRYINKRIFPLNLKKTRDVGRDLYKRQFPVIFFVARVDGDHAKYQQPVHQDGKGMIPIKNHGGQHRVYRFVKIFLYEFLLLRR